MTTQTDWEPDTSAVGNAALTAWHQHRTDTTFGAGKALAGQAAIEEYRRQMDEAGLVVVRRDVVEAYEDFVVAWREYETGLNACPIVGELFVDCAACQARWQNVVRADEALLALAATPSPED